jgi:hypothetical protein
MHSPLVCKGTRCAQCGAGAGHGTKKHERCCTKPTVITLTLRCCTKQHRSGTCCGGRRRRQCPCRTCWPPASLRTCLAGSRCMRARRTGRTTTALRTGRRAGSAVRECYSAVGVPHLARRAGPAAGGLGGGREATLGAVQAQPVLRGSGAWLACVRKKRAAHLRAEAALG